MTDNSGNPSLSQFFANDTPSFFDEIATNQPIPVVPVIDPVLSMSSGGISNNLTQSDFLSTFQVINNRYGILDN